MNKKQVALIVLDGWGYREDSKDNAIALAKHPHFDTIWKAYPHTTLEASGLAVGLPEGQMSNSEVGHMTIGSGKVMYQDLVRIKKSIEESEFAENKALDGLFKHVEKNNSTLHVMGMLSDGGVHSHMEHLFGILRVAKMKNIEKVVLHVFTDGRDTPPQSAGTYMKELEKVIEEVGLGTIASLAGRFYAMDRDNNWDRVAKVEEVIFKGEGKVITEKPSEYIESLYANNHERESLDEHFEPVVFGNDGKTSRVKNGDAIFFFNFRSDRARQLSQKVLERLHVDNLKFATLTEYDPEYGIDVAFPKIQIETTLAKEISNAGMTQAHIAETEKFPHATYYLNGGVEAPHAGEEHIMLPSYKHVPTHDLAPKMQAEGIANKAIEQIEKGTDFIFINFANPDMVGHTANVPALVEALEETDTQLGRVLEALHARGAVAFVTADHGNAEVNVDQVTGDKHTSHTINPVPAIFTNTTLSLRDDGTVADIAPTILEFFGLPLPTSMTGKSLVK